MLSTIRKQRDEEGFTLIELLVVVIIIGILAAIAIPVFLNQRENAWRSAVESDLRNAAVQIESVLTREGSYPDGFTEETGTIVELTVDEDDAGVSLVISENVTMTYAPGDTASDPYTITGEHANLPAEENTLIYNSGTGGLAEAEWGDGTAETPAG